MNHYTHGHTEAVLRSHRWRTAQNSAQYLLPHLTPDLRLLDVGSGPGTITADLAERVAEVVALEATPEAAALTRDELARRGIANATTVVGDVHDLDFEDGSFDVVHAHQVLQHLADPVRALQEMARVGSRWVAARDSDYGAFSWFPADPRLDRWRSLYTGAARANGGEPDAGRRLLHWAQAAGLTDVVAAAGTWCFASPEDRAWWGGLWADRIVSGALAEQVTTEGRASRAELEELSRAWREWADQPDGWFVVLHGEILVRLGG